MLLALMPAYRLRDTKLLMPVDSLKSLDPASQPRTGAHYPFRRQFGKVEGDVYHY